TLTLGISTLSFLTLQNINSSRNSLKVFYASLSGIQEAQLQLERNKDYNLNFNLSINGVNDVNVTFSNTNGIAISTSTASLNFINKKIQGVFTINSTSSLIIPMSITELSS
ncbi:MAG: hypothetical protein QW134_07970, partial [Nitrososphaeria archaeon]